MLTIISFPCSFLIQYQALSTGGEKIIDTFQKQTAHTLKFIRCIYFLSMSSKRIKSAALHEQMHNFDLPVYSIIFRTEKKSGIHYRNKAHMHIWIDFFTPLLLVINAFEFENNWKRCVAWTNWQRRPVTTGKKNQGFIRETKRISINLFTPLLVVINAL